MNKMRKMLKSEAGFTLIELLVVLLVLGILASVAVPRFMDMQGKATLVKAKTELKQVQTAMELYYAENGEYPADLAAFNTAVGEYVEATDLGAYTFANYTLAADKKSYTVEATFGSDTVTISRTDIN